MKKRYRIKATAFTISLVLTPILMVLAYRDRGYFACGGETLVPIIGFFAHYAFKEGGWKK